MKAEGKPMQFCIIETDDGWMIVEIPSHRTAEEVAAEQGAGLIDPGPYHSYDDATEALVGLQEELEDEGSSDVPGTTALEGRSEERP
jgi:hypothetical protein